MTSLPDAPKPALPRWLPRAVRFKRTLQNLAREVLATDAARPGFDEDGTQVARQLVALLSTALLRDALAKMPSAALDR